MVAAVLPSSPRSRRRALVGVGAVLLAGLGIGLAFAFRGSPPPAPAVTSKPAQVYVPSKAVPLSSEARRVAGTFVLTAVARRHLDQAWELAGPQLRSGITKAQWLTGAIPVVPYPVTSLDVAPMKIDYSYADRAQLRIALIPKKGASVRPQLFVMGLHAYGTGAKKRWLVDYWAPYAAPAVPARTLG